MEADPWFIVVCGLGIIAISAVFVRDAEDIARESNSRALWKPDSSTAGATALRVCGGLGVAVGVAALVMGLLRMA